MKKGLILIAAGLALLAAGAITARADEGAASGITASGINIKDIVSNTRAGVWLPFEGGKTFKTIYTPLIWAHSAAGVEFAALDVGAAAPGDLTQGYVFMAIGFRVDNLLDRAIGVSSWAKTHMSSAVLPSLEVGAGPILYAGKIRWGVSAAIKF